MFTRVWSHLKPSEKPRLSRFQALASEEANRAQSPKEGHQSNRGYVAIAIVYGDLPLQAENDRLNELREKNIKKRHKAAFLKLLNDPIRVSRTENALCNWYVCLSSNRVFFRNVVAVSSHVKSHSGAKAWRARADAEIQHIKEDQVGESRGPTVPSGEVRECREWDLKETGQFAKAPVNHDLLFLLGEWLLPYPRCSASKTRHALVGKCLNA